MENQIYGHHDLIIEEYEEFEIGVDDDDDDDDALQNQNGIMKSDCDEDQDDVEFPASESESEVPLSLLENQYPSITVSEFQLRKESRTPNPHPYAGKQLLTMNASPAPPAQLSDQVPIRTDRNIFVCPVCNRICSRSGHLEVHMRSHTGEKPYSCRMCSFKCSSANSLRRHEKTHIKIKHAVLVRKVKKIP